MVFFTILPCFQKMIAESCFDSNHTIRIQEWPRRHATESRKEDASEDNKWFFNVQFSPRGQKWQKIISQLEASKYLVKRFGSDIRFQLESSCVWISISGWKPMLPGTQPARDRVYGGTRPPNFWTGGHNIFCPPPIFCDKKWCICANFMVTLLLEMFPQHNIME